MLALNPSRRLLATLTFVAVKKGIRGMDADHLVYDTLTAAALNSSQFKGRNGADEMAWIIGILVNKAKMLHRAHGRRIPCMEHAALENLAVRETLEDEGPPSNAPDFWNKVRAQLPARYVRILTAHYVEGLTTREMAERFGTSHNTMRVALHRALVAARNAGRKD